MTPSDEALPSLHLELCQIHTSSVSITRTISTDRIVSERPICTFINSPLCPLHAQIRGILALEGKGKPACMFLQVFRKSILDLVMRANLTTTLHFDPSGLLKYTSLSKRMWLLQDLSIGPFLSLLLSIATVIPSGEYTLSLSSFFCTQIASVVKSNLSHPRSPPWTTSLYKLYTMIQAFITNFACKMCLLRHSLTSTISSISALIREL